MRLTVSEIAASTHGLIVNPSANAVECTGMTWDSRKVGPGDLYVALRGERVDGHSFVVSALESGAAAALVEQDPDASQIEAANRANAVLIKVDSTSDAVTRVAAYWRNCVSALVVALTGSSGKTTTKGLIRQVLEAYGDTIATEGNQNNELGVPATLLRIEGDTEFAVVEMGMRGLRQLESLCDFVKPDMALVTNVGTSHMELLGSRENIARAKAEPFLSLASGGVAFINSSDEYVAQLREFGCTKRDSIDEVFFDGSGVDPASYSDEIRPIVYASDIHVDAMGYPSFIINVPEDQAECALQMQGLHNVHNAMAAAAVGWKVGMTAQQISQALRGAEAASGRQKMHVTSYGVTVIDDAYNANPDSMRASLSMFATLGVKGRRIAVLGDMGELGHYTLEGHEAMGVHAVECGVDRLYCIGEFSKNIAQSALSSGMSEDSVCHVMDAMEVLARLKDELIEGDAVLVKASRSMALERIVEGLID